MNRRQSHIAVYGTQQIQRDYCDPCDGFALVVDGFLQCCYREHQRKPFGYQIMSQAMSIRRKPSAAVRRAILEEQENQCFYCDRLFGTWLHFPRKSFTIQPCWDHLVPLSYSRNNRDENFVAACSLCNGFKSDKLFDDVETARRYVASRWARKLAKFEDRKDSEEAEDSERSSESHAG